MTCQTRRGAARETFWNIDPLNLLPSPRLEAPSAEILAALMKEISSKINCISAISRISARRAE
jgi:hypothetical protein